MKNLSSWLNPSPWVETAGDATEGRVRAALCSEVPGIREFAVLLSRPAGRYMENLAGRAKDITRSHFGKTISLYTPLYISNYCTGGCAYCGFASDRKQPRRRLETSELFSEISALRELGVEDILLLTGERHPAADFDYLRECVALAAKHFHAVTVESFAMTRDEYQALAHAGCEGITLYQETYNRKIYAEVHRYGSKRDFQFRMEAPARALASGIRSVGMGSLLGLGDPMFEAISLFQHITHIRRNFWQAGVSISFPRVRPQAGGYKPAYAVNERYLAQIIFAFRICLPDVPLVLSTRESQRFRDGMAGLGINRMSVASRTTVGGYAHEPTDNGQFDVSDTRPVAEFCSMLRRKDLEPVFKNWDSVFRNNKKS
ncbi:MAG: 2-iminoacetate synthase ThiH [Kiritimatiellia bacterium]